MGSLPSYWPYVGDPADFVGRTSGWMAGRVTRTCYEYRDVPSGIPGDNPPYAVMMMCNFDTDARSELGDSGAAVFQPTFERGADGREEVHWLGSLSTTTDNIPGTPEAPTSFSIWDMITSWTGVAF